VNLKELSQLLNLSQTTVSRALNGYPEVNEDTRQRVLEAAREHRYQPNAAARRLATGKANAIGCVVPAVDGLTPQFTEFLAGVHEQAAKEGLDVVLAPAAGEDEAPAYRRLTGHGRVDGVFLFAPSRKDARIELLNELNLPFLVYGRAPALDAEFAHLDINNNGAFYNAARLLWQLGHRAIALLNGPRHNSTSVQRENGARRALQEAGADLPRERIINGDLSTRYGHEAACILLDAGAPPTALLCGSLFTALGVERAAHERGLEIGRDLSVIAHDDGFDYLDPEVFGVPMATTFSPLRKAGRRVAERLGARIRGVEKEPKGEIWQVDLVVRASLGPPPV